MDPKDGARVASRIVEHIYYREQVPYLTTSPSAPPPPDLVETVFASVAVAPSTTPTSPVLSSTPYF